MHKSHGSREEHACLRWTRPRPEPPLRSFESNVLVGCRVGEAGDQTEPGLADPRAHAVDKGQLPDRRVDAPFINGLLHVVQDRLAFLMIELDRLLMVPFAAVGGI